MKKEKKKMHRTRSELIKSSAFRILSFLMFIVIAQGLSVNIPTQHFAIMLGLLFIDKVYYFAKEL